MRDSLSPKYARQFRIASFNALGTGPFGPASVAVSTLPGPMPAPSAQAFLTTILLSWRPPVGGAIGYRIYAQCFGSLCPSAGTTYGWSPDTPPPQTVSGSTVSAKFDQLLSDTAYRYQLAARNPSGWGNPGPWTTTRTTIDAEAWVTVCTDKQDRLGCSSVVLLTVNPLGVGATSAGVVWARDATTDPVLRGSAMGFLLLACTVTDAEGNAEVCDDGGSGQLIPVTVSSWVRGGLLKNTYYDVRLVVVNAGGAGPASKPSAPFQTRADYPTPMAAPTAVPVAADSIRVSWNPVVDWNARGGLDVIDYVIFMRTSGQASA